MDKLYAMYVKNMALKQMLPIKNWLLLVGMVSIEISLPLWLGMFFQNQQWLHKPNNIHNCGNSTQWRTIYLLQLENLIKIPHGHSIVQVVIRKNACAHRIKRMFENSGIIKYVKNGWFNFTKRGTSQFGNQHWCDSNIWYEITSQNALSES